MWLEVQFVHSQKLDQHQYEPKWVNISILLLVLPKKSLNSSPVKWLKWSQGLHSFMGANGKCCRQSTECVLREIMWKVVYFSSTDATSKQYCQVCGKRQFVSMSTDRKAISFYQAFYAHLNYLHIPEWKQFPVWTRHKKVVLLCICWLNAPSDSFFLMLNTGLPTLHSYICMSYHFLCSFV